MPSLRARCAVGCLVLAISFVFPTLLCAQGATGRILGRVADPSGAVLSGVKVTLTNTATGVSRSAVTGDSGDYSFLNVAPAIYDESFELSGFKKNVQKSITIDVNQVLTLNSVLQIGGAQEIVDVTSEAPKSIPPVRSWAPSSTIDPSTNCR